MQSQTKTVFGASTKGSKTKLWAVYFWSLSFLKPYLSILLILITLVSFVSATELVFPKFIHYFIDVILPQRDFTKFYFILIVLGVLIVLMLGANVMQNLLRRHLQEKAARDLQFSIFQHLRKLGFAYYEQNPVGQTLSLLNTEVAALQNLYRNTFPLLVDGIIFSVISLFMMASTSLRLSLIVLPCFFLYYIFGPSLERKTSLSSKLMSQYRIEENRKVYESISALRDLRVFSSERWDLERYLEKIQIFNSTMIKTYFYACLRGTNRRLTYNIGAILLLICGYNFIRSGELSVGAFVSFILYYFIAMDRLTRVVTNITEQKVLLYQAERLYSFMQLKPQVNEVVSPVHLTNSCGKIQFNRVNFAYAINQPVLSQLSLTIHPGKRVALVGTSGNGKSTLLKLIGRFYDPAEGEITIDDIPIQELSFSSLRDSLGYVFQETYLFGTTIRENIRFGKTDATEEEIVNASKAAFAHEFISGLQDGYDTLVGERGIKLSGGQKQRIAIARMLIKNPAIILLDEATSALDNSSESEVQKALDVLLKGRTVVAVAHRLSTIKDFDTIAVIEDGQVKESGTYEELLMARGAFYQLVNGQKSTGGDTIG